MAARITPTSKQECEATLNVKIPENVWNENPRFASLLVELVTKNLRKFSIHTKTWSKYQKEMQENDKIRSTYLQYKLLFDTINSILYEKSNDETPVSLMATHAMDMIAIHQASYLDQPYIAKKYFDTFMKDMDKPEGLKMLKESIVPVIEDRLTQTALKLLQLRDHTTNPNKTHLLLAKLKQLPSLLEQEIEQCETYKHSKLVNDLCLQKNLEILLRKQLEYSKLLQTYLSDNSEYVWNRESLEANLLLSKFQTMFEKLECIDKQIHVDAYTPENVQALEIVHQKLIELKQSFLQEIHETKALLVSYGGLGPEYTLIVEEYGQIDKQIEAARDVLGKTID